MRLLTSLLALALVSFALPVRAQSLPPADAPLAAPRGSPVSLRPFARPARVAIEAGSGMAFGFAGGAALGLFGLVVACQNPNTANRTCLQGALIGATAGYLVGVPLGVYLVGNALGGQGKFSWTFLGTLLGEAGGLAMIAFAPLSALFILVPGVGGVVGGLLGYELSSHELPGAPPLTEAGGVRGMAWTF